MTRKLLIEVDEQDESAILNAIAQWQAKSHAAFGETMLPEGQSDIRGATLAEICREHEEYRSLWHKPLPLSDLLNIKEAIEYRAEHTPSLKHGEELRETLAKFVESMK